MPRARERMPSASSICQLSVMAPRLEAAVFLLVLLLVAPLSLSLSPDRSLHPRLLVLIDDVAVKASHSLFFNSLADRGYKLDYKLASDPSLALKNYGEYLFDGLILFAPSAEYFGGSVDAAGILEFVDSGRNLIVAADSEMSDVVRAVTSECGVDFDEDSSAVVIDHINFAVTEDSIDHSLIAADSFVKSTALLGEKDIEAPVLFEGIAHSVAAANSLAVNVLSASSSAYSMNPDMPLSDPPSLSGSKISLVSVVQARNNARILISGSLSLFSNKFFMSPVTKFGSSSSYERSGNKQFVEEISKWIFHERGHLKAVSVRHHKVGELQEPQMYRITDHLEYSLKIYEWMGKDWQPYLADDVQVQFYMMSPYILKTLEHNGQGLYHTSFQVPDVYGVFQFKLEYNRLGYTTISLSKQIPVRPFRHDEYERFIRAAYPYYSSCFSMMFGFFVFGIVFLYHK